MAAREVARAAEERHESEGGLRSRLPGGLKKGGQTKRSIFVAFSRRPCSLFCRDDEEKTREREREKERAAKGKKKKIRGTPRGSRADVSRRVPPYNFDLQPRKESNMAVPAAGLPCVS